MKKLLFPLFLLFALAFAFVMSSSPALAGIAAGQPDPVILTFTDPGVVQVLVAEKVSCMDCHSARTIAYDERIPRATLASSHNVMPIFAVNIGYMPYSRDRPIWEAKK